MKPISATQSSVPCPTNNLSCVLEGKLTLHQSAVFVVCIVAIWTVAYTMFSFAPLTSGSWELHKNELTVIKCFFFFFFFFPGMLCFTHDCWFTWLESYITIKNKEYRYLLCGSEPNANGQMILVHLWSLHFLSPCHC